MRDCCLVATGYREISLGFEGGGANEEEVPCMILEGAGVVVLVAVPFMLPG